MSLETATYIDALVTSNPDGTDARTTADDHLRLIKAALKRTFPLIGGAVSASALAVSYVNDLSASVQAQLNALRDGSHTAANAINSQFANSASFAILSNFAQSASYAAFAGSAVSASYAQSASFAAQAGFAQSASFAALATQASNALSLGGVAAAGYAQLQAPQTFTKGQAVQQVDQPGSVFAVSCDTGNMFRLTLTGNASINAPTAPRSGMVITFHLVQDATGGRTAAWSSAFRFAGGTRPVLSTAAGAVDVFAFQYDLTDNCWRQAGLNVS